MKAKEIEKGNKLIAEFMDKKPITELEAYHSSWDWLIPVIQKIKNTRVNGDLLVVEILFGLSESIRTQCSIAEFDGIIVGDCVTDNESDIEVVWSTVVQFIKWWNKKNKKHKTKLLVS